MKKETFFEKIKNIIGGLAFNIFLKCAGYSQEEYWKHIYLQEKLYRELKKEEK